MQVRGKTLRCFSVILAFSKSLHETCRLLRALHTFFFFKGGLPRFDSRSWDNILSDCLPLMTRAAKPLWGVTSSVAAIVYSIRVASRSSRQAQASSCLTRAKRAHACIVNFEVATTSPFRLKGGNRQPVQDDCKFTPKSRTA